jgi:hypothetical protein
MSNSTICTYFSYRDGVIKCDLEEQHFNKREFSIEAKRDDFHPMLAKYNICNPLGYLLALIDEDPMAIFSVFSP